MEELRDERLSKIIGWLQSYIRGYIARKEFKKLQDQRLVNSPRSINSFKNILLVYLFINIYIYYALWLLICRRNCIHDS